MHVRCARRLQPRGPSGHKSNRVEGVCFLLPGLVLGCWLSEILIAGRSLALSLSPLHIIHIPFLVRPDKFVLYLSERCSSWVPLRICTALHWHSFRGW